MEVGSGDITMADGTIGILGLVVLTPGTGIARWVTRRTGCIPRGAPGGILDIRPAADVAVGALGAVKDVVGVGRGTGVGDIIDIVTIGIVVVNGP